MECKWCGEDYDPETRKDLHPDLDGVRHSSKYCSETCEMEADDDAREIDLTGQFHGDFY